MDYSSGDGTLKNSRTRISRIGHFREACPREDGEWALIISVIHDICNRESILVS